jgi:hypothetical protein
VKKNWYHITDVHRGPEFTASRRPPILRTESEPLTPRICVCPDLPGCFSAVLFHPKPVYVYRYCGGTNPPLGVWDHQITGERWVVVPSRLVFETEVDWRVVRDIYAATLLRIQNLKKLTTWKVRLAQYCVAAKFLKMESRWTRMIQNRYLGGMDPEDYILAG